jgi:hypothetical protein
MSRTPQPSIVWEDVEQALVDWAAEASGLEVIWAEENGPQPERPYVVLDWLSFPSAVGDDYFSDELDSDEEIIERSLEGVREATLNVQVYASSTRAGQNAAYYCDLLSNSLGSDTMVLEHFTPVRMAPWDWQAIAKGDFAEDGKAISRAGFDIRLGFSAGTGAVSERVAVITNVALTGTFADPPATDLVSATAVTS